MTPFAPASVAGYPGDYQPPAYDKAWFNPNNIVARYNTIFSFIGKDYDNVNSSNGFNKIKGIRCAVCWSAETAKLAKEHNNANVIAIGERQVTKDLAIEIIDVWLSSEFQGERHARRIQMLDSL